MLKGIADRTNTAFGPDTTTKSKEKNLKNKKIDSPLLVSGFTGRYLLGAVRL